MISQMVDKIVIGSRGSELALWQAGWVKKELSSAYQNINIEINDLSI